MSEKFLTGTEKNSEETKKNHVDSTVDVIDRIGSHLENILMKTYSNVTISRSPVYIRFTFREHTYENFSKCYRFPFSRKIGHKYVYLERERESIGGIICPTRYTGICTDIL